MGAKRKARPAGKRSVQLMKTDKYKVEVQGFADRPREVVVWVHGGGGFGWIFQASMAIPEDVDAAVVEREVMSRLR